VFFAKYGDLSGLLRQKGRPRSGLQKLCLSRHQLGVPRIPLTCARGWCPTLGRPLSKRRGCLTLQATMFPARGGWNGTESQPAFEKEGFRALHFGLTRTVEQIGKNPRCCVADNLGPKNSCDGPPLTQKLYLRNAALDSKDYRLRIFLWISSKPSTRQRPTIPP